MKFKKISLLLLIAFSGLLILTGCGNTQSETEHKGKLTIGLEGTYAPFSYRNKEGKLTGFDVEVSQAIAKKMKLKPEYKLTGWDSLIAGINSKSYDVVFNDLAVNPQRKKQYRMATPYAYSRAVLITKKDSPIKSLTDIKGKTFGEGTGTDNWKIAKKYKANVISAPEFSSALKMIQQGRTQGSINSEPAFKYWQKSHPNSSLTYRLIPNSQVKSEAIAPMMNKKSALLNKKMNKAIKELKQDGTLKRISNKYFGEDITEK